MKILVSLRSEGTRKPEILGNLENQGPYRSVQWLLVENKFNSKSLEEPKKHSAFQESILIGIRIRIYS